MSLLAQVSADVPTSVYAIGVAVVGALVATIGVLFKLLLTQIDGRRADNDLRREDQKAYTAAILAERAARDAANAPVAEALGKIAASLSEVTAQAREHSIVIRENSAALKTNTENTQKMFDRVMEVRKASVREMPAVKP